MKRLNTLLAATAITTISASAAMAEKWDMPMAYPATNYHTENGVAFAACV
ncbi:MAG: C4-dicarboxylate ABC transporter substrate-binding protein, partial [Paracoccaceae bacterium]|nr:C4-dicarboxylate ABC transporter substrate-binding protein [Paracoccaceae bacterium]